MARDRSLLDDSSISSSSPVIFGPSTIFPSALITGQSAKIYPQLGLIPKIVNTKTRKVRIQASSPSRFYYIIWFLVGLCISLISFLIIWSLDFIHINLNGFGTESDNQVNRTYNDVPNFCTSSICMQAGARLLRRINSSQDPCSDFYGFSCGNFIATREIPDDGFQRSTLQEMQETLLVEIKKLIDQPGSRNENLGVRKARQLYSSCMHSSFRTSHYTDYKYLPIFNVLRSDKVGIWPILMGSTWNQSEYSVERLFGQLFAHQVQSLLKLYVSPDETDPTKYMLEFYKGEPSMASSFYLNGSQPDYVKYLRSYQRLLLESVLLLSHGKQGSPTVTADVEAILKFEIKFAKLVQNSRCHLDGYDYDTGEDDYGHVAIKEITAKIPQINWLQLIQNLFENLGLNKSQVTHDMVVYFHCSDFFPKLVSLMESTDKRTLSNYLIWRFVFRYMPFLGNKFMLIWIEFMKDVPDTNEERLHLSRWKQCASAVNDGFGLAVAHLYVRNAAVGREFEPVRTMIQYLKKAFELVIGQQDWVPEYFKSLLIEKLTKMSEKIGYPSYILDEAALEKEYEGLEINDQEYFLMNILKLRKFEVLKEIRKINQIVDREKDWVIPPLVANAYHNPAANEIVLPLGILRYPMYHAEYPMYLNFANLGIVLSHEMVHGFDHQGRFYDKTGNFTHWWPEDVVNGFRKQALCFTEQYSKFHMPIIGNLIDGNTTLSDNVCDNSALRITWLAYQLWIHDHGHEAGLPGVTYTIPEIFYITYAQIWCEILNKEGYEQYIRDPHSPGQFRAIGVAQNNRDFGQIFQCPVGSAMNPPEKCILWS